MNKMLDSIGERGKKELLIRLPDKDFRSICCINKEFHSYANQKPNSEELFEERSLYWFDNELLQFREENIPWREFYNRTFKILNNHLAINILIRTIELMELKILHKLNRVILTRTHANIAVMRRNVDIIKWLSELSPSILPDDLAISVSYIDGHLDVLKCLANLNPPILPTQNRINLLVKYNHFEAVKWFASRSPPLLPIKEAIFQGYKRGHNEIVLWCIDNKIYP